MSFNNIFEKNVTFNNFKSQKVGLHLLSLENEFLGKQLVQWGFKLTNPSLFRTKMTKFSK